MTDTRDRRRFLRDVGRAAAATTSAAVFGSLAGCSGGRSSPAPAPTPRPTGTSAPPSTTPPVLPLNAAAWSALAASMTGPLVLPSSSSYGAAKLVHNLRFADTDPAAVAYCATPTDVQRCVVFARDHALTATPRCGGHSYGGYSTGTGLVVDVSRMNSVAPDPAHLRAVVGAGTQLVDVYQQLANAGMLLPAGSCPTVGISGLTLGGGIGVVGRKYGLTCDNVESFDIVTADGRHLTCTADDHADLFWANRGGGGGNFGIVTSFTFATHPLPELALFTFNWPWAAAADVLGAWQQWTATSPDEVWSNCQLQSAGSGGLSVRVNGVFVGAAGALTTLLRPLLIPAGAPSRQFVGPASSYLHAMLVEAGCEDVSVAQCHLAGENPSGTLSRSTFAATSAYLTTALSDAGVNAVLGAVEQLHSSVPQIGGGIVFDAYGGAINAVAPDATAFVHRRSLCAMQSSTSWAQGASIGTVNVGRLWPTDTAKAMAPFVSDAAYQNYIDPGLADWESAYYGSNLSRLVSVKRGYDPDDFFHFAQSIPTRMPT